MGKPKKKKVKTLSQDEIWDDSALINSWNEALEEYNVSQGPSSNRKKYPI